MKYKICDIQMVKKKKKKLQWLSLFCTFRLLAVMRS